MAEEKTIVLSVRKGILKTPRYKRASKAVRTLRELVQKYTSSKVVKIGPHLNLKIWENGMRNVPTKYKINTSKDDKGIVTAELFGAPKPKVESTNEKKDDAKQTKAPDKKVPNNIKSALDAKVSTQDDVNVAAAEKPAKKATPKKRAVKKAAPKTEQ